MADGTKKEDNEDASPAKKPAASNDTKIDIDDAAQSVKVLCSCEADGFVDFKEHKNNSGASSTSTQ